MFPPERIVCLTEETVETLYLLGEERRIVGVSGYCVRPPEARRDKPRVADARPLFQSMFTTPPRQGVSPVVTNVWMPAKAGADNAVQALDLFTDPKPVASRGGKV